MTTNLEVTKRTASASAVRKEEQIPGVVYGPKQESISISIDKRLFEKTLHEAGESTIISLEGLGEAIEVLIHDVAFNAEKGGVEHVDFYAIERGKELTTNVALEFIGEAPVEKNGATVNKILHELEVTCRPSDLPSNIEVDISGLTEDTSEIRIADLAIPEGVTVENDAEEVVVNVFAARVAEPEPESETVDMDSVEVEGKGKEEGEIGEDAGEEGKE